MNISIVALTSPDLRSETPTLRSRHWSDGKLTSQFQNLCSEILQDGTGVDSSLCADADVMLCALLQVTVDTPNWELYSN